ncbi:MAG: hypothetical protein R3B47_18500 [Bacteroidia bacterium]
MPKIPMRNILHTWFPINLSKYNQNFRLAKLSRRRDIDLKDLDFVDGQSAEDLLKKNY